MNVKKTGVIRAKVIQQNTQNSNSFYKRRKAINKTTLPKAYIEISTQIDKEIMKYHCLKTLNWDGSKIVCP